MIQIGGPRSLWGRGRERDSCPRSSKEAAASFSSPWILLFTGGRRRGQNYGHLRGRGTEKGKRRRGRRNQDFGKRKGREGPRFMRSLLCHLEEESFSASMGNKVSH